MGKNNYFDDDDLRNRRYVNQHPQFYLKAVYDPQRDIYVLNQFVCVNTSDAGERADFVECPVNESHIIKYKDEYQKFVEQTKMPRYEYTRDEMMCVHDYRETYEYNKSIVLLPETNPDYQRIISDFSIKLRPEGLFSLRRLDGIQEPAADTEPAKETASDDKLDKVLIVLKSMAGQLGDLTQRVQTIETQIKEV